MKKKESPEHKNKIVDDGESMKKKINDIEKEKQQFTWAAAPEAKAWCQARRQEEPDDDAWCPEVRTMMHDAPEDDARCPGGTRTMHDARWNKNTTI